MAAAAPDYENSDEWELVNDDGFVYKRKKRRTDSTSSASAPPPPDPAVERKHRRERKKRALLKLRDKYLREIRHWEHLSNALKDMDQNAQAQRQEPVPTTSFGEASTSEEYSSSNSTGLRLVEDFLSQVEGQECIIKAATNLCDMAEALCSAEEERLKQQFTDLPIWDPSPDELMAALGGGS